MVEPDAVPGGGMDPLPMVPPPGVRVAWPWGPGPERVEPAGGVVAMPVVADVVVLPDLTDGVDPLPIDPPPGVRVAVPWDPELLRAPVVVLGADIVVVGGQSVGRAGVVGLGVWASASHAVPIAAARIRPAAKVVLIVRRSSWVDRSRWPQMSQ